MKRKQFLRSLSALLILGTVLFAFSSCKSTDRHDPAEKTEETTIDTTQAVTTKKSEEPEDLSSRTIDVYLIAGQSNAAGYTVITDEEALYRDAPELRSGLSHVYYAGNSRYDSGGRLIDVKHPLGTLKPGLGISKKQMGPEVGLGVKLSDCYNEESGKYACLIKMAHGGASLMNDTAGSNQFGNWVSPSYAEYMGIDYTGATGGLYRELLAEVEKQIANLKTYRGGFANVRIVGMYWMQGEHDRDKPRDYQLAFKYLIKDLRRDLSAIVKASNKNGEDGGASEMAIIVGSISETFADISPTSVQMSRDFIKMQSELPKKFTNVWYVDNSQFVIVGPNGIVGSDQYHWNQADQYQIGKNVGQVILDGIVG